MSGSHSQTGKKCVERYTLEASGGGRCKTKCGFDQNADARAKATCAREHFAPAGTVRDGRDGSATVGSGATARRLIDTEGGDGGGIFSLQSPDDGSDRSDDASSADWTADDAHVDLESATDTAAQVGAHERGRAPGSSLGARSDGGDAVVARRSPPPSAPSSPVGRAAARGGVEPRVRAPPQTSSPSSPPRLNLTFVTFVDASTLASGTYAPSLANTACYCAAHGWVRSGTAATSSINIRW